MSELAKRLILVGEINPYGSDPGMALFDKPDRASGNRIRLILGLDRSVYRQTRRFDLCVGKWSAVEARKAASKISQEVVTPGCVLVLLGRKVQEAFGLYKMTSPYYIDVPDNRSVCKGRFRIVLSPHPSGLCRVWSSDPTAKDRVRQYVQEYLPELYSSEPPDNS